MEFTKRQIEIIHAATGLIGEKGIQNLTTKALAERMNFSEPALYRHFKDKNDILKSVILYFREELKSAMEEISDAPTNGLEKLGQIIEFQFEHFANNPAIVMVIFAETSFQFDESLSDAVHAVLISKKTRMVQLIEKGQKDGSIRKDLEPTALANIFMGSMRFTVLQWRLSKYSTSLIADGAQLWNSLRTLLSAPPSQSH
jgi:AcrR family transcriptional regulator